MAIKEPPLQRGQRQAQSGAQRAVHKHIVQRVAIPRNHRRGWLPGVLGGKLRFAERRSRMLAGYAVAVISVALVTGAIGLVTTFFHVGLSLIYLLVILWLAVSFGRGPSIVASFLAFLAYDFFFVPPFHRLTVDDPAQWIALFALLATALVIGQLTVIIQGHAREALASEQRTRRLYALAQMIGASADEEPLLQGLVEQVAQVFAPPGVAAAALILPDANGDLLIRAAAPAAAGATARAVSLPDREQALLAKWALQHGESVGSKVSGDDAADYTVFYIPLVSRRRALGVLAIAGRAEIRALVVGRNTLAGAANRQPSASRPTDPQAQLLLAFCDQIALALERVLLQQQAIHAEALRESERLKSVLLSSVTHDLRTPLAAIKASTSSLLEPGMTWHDGDYLEFVQSIDASVDRLSHLVSNLLDLSRLEAGTVVPEKDWYPIGDVIATVLDRLDAAEQTKEHTIEVELPDDVPLAPLDHEQIESVLTNLIENALKYSPPGSVIRVQARQAREMQELEVRVSDQGIGIPADQLTAIFEKFYRAPQARLPWASTRQPAGTGLGLAICATAIRAHKGRIWAESTPGKGATFIFTLPIPADRPAGELPEARAFASPALSPATGANGEQRTGNTPTI